MSECKRCGYKWRSKVDTPKQCPKCKRYDWDKGDLHTFTYSKDTEFVKCVKRFEVELRRVCDN